jgi:hypothetical protein
MNATTIRFFQRAVYLWVLGYLLSAYRVGEWLWVHPVSPPLPVPGPLGFLMNAFGTWLPPEATMLAVPVLLVFAVFGLWRPQPVWMAFVTWALFASLVQRAWLASCGGLLLMDNVLFWMIFLRFSPNGRFAAGLGELAFWMIRIQVIFTYIITGLHKLTGTSWLNGTAVGIVSSDPLFGPHWLAQLPWLSALVTWTLLAFQFAFPVAVWFPRTKRPFLAFGALFHLGTALWMGIPEMAFAFIACYTIWLSEEEVQRGTQPGSLAR